MSVENRLHISNQSCRDDISVDMGFTMGKMKRNKTKQNETKKLNPVRDDISVEKRLHISNHSRQG